MLDLTTLSDEELDGLRIEVLTELERRMIVATAAQQIAALEAAYERATMQDVTLATTDHWRNQVTEQLN